MGFRDTLRALVPKKRAKSLYSNHSNQASSSDIRGERPKSAVPPQATLQDPTSPTFPATHQVSSAPVSTTSQSSSQIPLLSTISTQGVVSNASVTPPVIVHPISSSSNPPSPAPSQPIQCITGSQATPQLASSSQSPSVFPSQPTQPTTASRKVVIRSLWDEAVEKLSTEDQEYFKTSTNDKLNTLELFIEETKKKRDEYKEKQWKCTSYADKFLAQLDKLAKVGDVFIKQSPSIVAMPWTGFRFLLQIPLNNIEIIENVLLALEYIAHTLGRCSIYEQLHLKASNQTRSAQNLRAALPDLYAAILMYLTESRKHFVENTAVRAMHSTWDPYISRFKPLMENIKEREGTVEYNVHAARDQNQVTVNEKHDIAQQQQMEKLQKILETMAMPQIQQELEDINRRIKENENDVERQAILKWLSKIYFEDHHNLIKSNRHSGSGEWLFNRKQFINWKEAGESSILWLRGFPGAGKTHLTSAVIDQFMTTRRKDEAVAYFYCKYDQEERRDPSQILRAIVKQLSTVEPGSKLPQPVVDIYKKRKDSGFKSGPLTISESQSLLIEMIAAYKFTLICVDALDECHKETRGELLDTLQEILKKSTSHVKVFISSRDDQDITLHLEGLPNVHIQATDNHTDIDRFTRDEVDRLVGRKKLMHGFDSPELRTTVIQHITSRAGGMFLWASLQIQSFCREKTKADLERAMIKMPDGLDQTFKVILGRIDAQSLSSRTRARKALMLILGAQKPLSCDQLIQALDMESRGEIMAGGLTSDVVLDECQNFVILDQKLGVFRFAHLSVNDFVKSLFSEAEVHANFAEICLSSLLWQKRQVSLVKYALDYWHIHIQLSNTYTARDNLIELQKELLLSEENYTPFLKVITQPKSIKITKYIYLPNKVLWKATPWNISCAYGLFDMCSHFLDLKEGSNRHGMSIEGGLCLAAACGREHMFERLLAIPRIDVNEKDHFFKMTALMHAAESGSEAIAKMLLARKDIDVNCTGDNGRTALMYAAAGSRGEAVAKMLLARKDIDVNCKEDDGRTALMYAAQFGGEAIAKMLLARKDIDVNCKEDDGKAALMYAAQFGSEAIAKMLLARKDIDVNCNGKTALMYAAQFGSEAIAKMLLAREDIDVNCKDHHKVTPLHFVICGSGDIGSKVLPLLLARDEIDVNAKDGEGSTPIYYAVLHKKLESLKLLLAREDVDINCVNYEGNTPLRRAISTGQEEAVRLLLTRRDLIVQKGLDYESSNLSKSIKAELAARMVKGESTNIGEVMA